MTEKMPPCKLGRWSSGRIHAHGALALSGFRTTLAQNPHLQNLPIRLTVRILSPFGRSTPFYRDLTEVLPILSNLQHLDIRYAAPPASSSSSPFQLPLPPLSLWTLTPPELIFSISSSAHRARPQDEDADFPALASAHAAPTSLKTLRALEHLELSGRMLDGMRTDDSNSTLKLETNEGSGGLWYNTLKSLRLPHLPAAPAAPTPTTSMAPTAPNTHPDALTALFSIRQSVYTPARLGLDDAEWAGGSTSYHEHDPLDAELGYKGCWNLDGPRAEVEMEMMTWVRAS
ncbi:hypothetical protein EYR40_000025 [Pleurotus pulmonarius]|nr:hypothetical protein EYR40_000025 [Pleurotus pulmonarius]